MTDIAHHLAISTSTVIQNQFLRYNRAVSCQVKIITMDMLVPTMLRIRISRLRLKQSPRLFHFKMQKLSLIAFPLHYYISKLKLKEFTGLFYSNT